MHSSKARFLPSSKTPVQKITLAIIILATLSVLAALICSIIFNPERMVKSTLSRLATEYYEDYFYPHLSSDPAQALEKYTNTGLAKVTLRQLLLYDDEKNAEYQSLFDKYCDINNTSVQFFPIAPFGQSDYRIDYTYSCNF